MIPEDPELWKVENFENLLEQRRMLMAEDINNFMNELVKGTEAQLYEEVTDTESLISRGENEALERENIEARPLWKPMHLQPLYKTLLKD